MKNTLAKILILFIFVSQLLLPAKAVVAYDQNGALSYLQAHAENPWSTMALTLLNSNSIPLDHLKNISSSKAIDYEAPILALTAQNKDPRNFGNEDYIAKLKSFHANGQIGDPQTLNDDIFGILALVSAGEPASNAAILDAKNFLLSHQNQDGGFGFAVGSSSDTNTTASAICALISLEVPQQDQIIQSALNYLKAAQNEDGGFPYDPKSPYGTDSDSSSTAWVIWALNALQIDPAALIKSDNTPLSYLEGNQASEGYFEYQKGSPKDSFSAITTAYAVVALTGRTLPINKIAPGQNLNFKFRIEGSQETVCEGETVGPTALDVVKNAGLKCGFTYHISNTSFGPYLDQIENDEAQGLIGWLYFVNNISPDVGAADYRLKEGDEVLWYFGEFGWQPTRLSLDPVKISSGQSSQALVEGFTSGSWQPLKDAVITLGAVNFTADANGKSNINAPDGYYKVFASKTGAVRSNSVLLQIGQPSSQNVTLNANITSGDVRGTSTQPGIISFSVDQQTLDFGSVKIGSSAAQTLKISNTGSSNLTIETIISGDSVFVDNLKIQDTDWRKFKTNLLRGQNQDKKVELAVPANYSGALGQKNGQLIFWAIAE